MDEIRDSLTLAVLFCSLYFEIFMLMTYVEKREVLKGKGKKPVQENSVEQNMPGVTIIVPCFNEEKTFAKTIDSLLNIDYPESKLKIMVVNDGSTDGTRAALEKYNGHERVKVIHKENGGKHTALNLGIGMAETEFVGCLDADSYASPDSLKRIMRRFDDSKVMAVVPSLHVHNAKTLIQKMQKVEYLLGTFLRTMLSELNALYVTPGPLSIIRKSVFDKIGPYRKAYNTEDMEMAFRMQANGMKIVNAHDAIVHTSSPHTIKKLYKQRVRWTSGFLFNLRDYSYMVASPKYGHLGGFVLPAMLIGTASVLLVIVTVIWDVVEKINTMYMHIEAVGWARFFEFSWPKFDWFYFQTTPLMWSGLVALFVIFCFIFLGMKLSSGTRPNLFEVACYAFLYPMIVPFWIARSVYNLAMSRQPAWR